MNRANSSDNEAEIRRNAAAILGRARTPAKVAAAQQNGKLGGRPAGFTPTKESRARQSEALRLAWQAKKAQGGTWARGRAPQPLEALACICGSDATKHQSLCPRGRAIKRRECK